MKRILFLIHDLGPGGAEKVLVNLVNNMDREKFDVTVLSLFDVGVNKQFLAPHVHYKYCFKHMIRGNSHLMKLLAPKALHKWLIKEHYDIEVSYLEGPCARIISGCEDNNTTLVSWTHFTAKSCEDIAVGFRSFNEVTDCYARFSKNVFVSREVMKAFNQYCPLNDSTVLYNTNESERIVSLADEPLDKPLADDEIKLIAVGRIIEVKGFDRLARIHKRLRDNGYPVHTYVLGIGNKFEELSAWVSQNGLNDSFTFLGYQKNPYKFVKKSDIFVCSSHSEGFSTAATESLIVGTPVVTTLVSGMKEMLGENNEYGIVTENNEDALYEGIKSLLDNPERLSQYKILAAERGKSFSTENTVKAVEEMLLNLR